MAVTFIAKTSSSSSLTLSKPAGVAAGNLLLVIFYDAEAANSGTTSLSSTNSGWTFGVGAYGTANVTGFWLYGWKIATSSEPTSYTFSLSDMTPSSYGITLLAYSGADSTTPVNKVATTLFTSGGDTTYAIPSVTPTSAGVTLGLGFNYLAYAVSSRSGLTNRVDVHSAGMTLDVNEETTAAVSGTATPSNTSITWANSGYGMSAALVLANASAATVSGAAALSSASSIATSGSSSSPPVKTVKYVSGYWTSGLGAQGDAPPNIVAGNVLIAMVYNSSSPTNATMTVDAGWTAFTGGQDTSGSGNWYYAWKVATASEPASYSFTVGGNNSYQSNVILQYSGVDTTNPIGQVASTKFTSSASWAMPTVTPVANGAALYAACESNNGNGVQGTFSSGITDRQYGASSSNVALDVAELNAAATSNTTTPANVVFTPSTADSGWGVVLTLTSDGKLTSTSSLAVSASAFDPTLTQVASTDTDISAITSTVGQLSIATKFTTGASSCQVDKIALNITAAAATTDQVVVGIATAIGTAPSAVTWLGTTPTAAALVPGGVQKFALPATVTLNASTTYYLVVQQAAGNGAAKVGTTSAAAAPSGDLINSFSLYYGSTSWGGPAGYHTAFSLYQSVGVSVSLSQSSALTAAATVTGGVTTSFVGSATTIASTGSTSVAYPAGTQAGDLVVVMMSSSGSVYYDTPTGWTEVYDHFRNSSPTIEPHLAIYTKLAASGESSTTFNMGSGSATTRPAYFVTHSYRVSGGTPATSLGVDHTQTGTTFTFPTPGTPYNCIASYAWVDLDNTVTTTPPAGVTQDFYYDEGSAGLKTYVGHETLTAGTPPTRTLTVSPAITLAPAEMVVVTVFPAVPTSTVSLTSSSSMSSAGTVLSQVGTTDSTLAASSSTANTNAATSFTTGTNGATVTAIMVPWVTESSGDSVRVGIATATSSPGSITWVGATPNVQSMPNTFASGNMLFTLPAAITLNPSTSYYLVLQSGGGNGAYYAGAQTATPAPTGLIATVSNSMLVAGTGAASWSTAAGSHHPFVLYGTMAASTVTGSATLGSTSSLSGAPSTTVMAGSPLTASSSLAAAAIQGRFGAAALSSTSVISATLGSIVNATAALSVASSTTISATKFGVVSGAATLTSSAALTSAGKRTVFTTASLTATSSEIAQPSSSAYLLASSSLYAKPKDYASGSSAQVTIQTVAGTASIDPRYHVLGVTAKVSVPDIVGDVSFGPTPPVTGSDTATVLVNITAGTPALGTVVAGDYFTSPIKMDQGSGTVSVNPGQGTIETDEQNPGTYTGSVWLYLNPSNPGYLTVNGTTTALTYAVELWQGTTLAGLTQISSQTFTVGDAQLPAISTTVAGSTAYYVRVASSTAGPISIDWTFDARVPQLVFQLTNPLLGVNSSGTLDTTPGSLNVSVVGADPGEQVSFSLPNGTVLATYTTDDTGVIAGASLDIPALSAGQYNVTATTLTSGRFGVQLITVNTDPGAHPTLPAADVIVSTIPSASVNKWVFVNPPTGETYTLPINPNRMTSPHAPRNVYSEITTAPDGQMILWEGARRCQPWTFEGFILDQAHYEKMEQFLALNNRMIIVDHRLRAWVCSIESFEPQKIGYETNPYWAKYSVTAFIYGGGDKVTPV